MAYTNINKSSDFFIAKLHTGTGSSNAITGVGFQPDLLWIKSRSSTYSHSWTDAVRGKDNKIASNNSNAQYTDAGQLTSFDSDGFTLSTDAGVNNNGSTYASWNWKANGAGSSNTDGSITSTVSASTTSGFSIVKWTGTSANATIGHGLGAVPKMIIIKSLANATFWMVYHSAIGNNSEIYLNRADYGASASSTAWQDTDPTSSVFYVGGGAGDGVNASGDYIAYCFAEKQGFSSIGSYVGNANADGTFVYTNGMKPAWIMMKKIAGSGYHWFIFDNKRDGYNNSNKNFEASSSNAEADTSPAGNIDILSNGFKIRTTDGHIADAGEYLYIAFAEAPLVGSNNVPCTAR
jgi:hypothetical protein